VIRIKRKAKNITGDQNFLVDDFPDPIQCRVSESARLAQGAARIGMLGVWEQALPEAPLPSHPPCCPNSGLV